MNQIQSTTIGHGRAGAQIPRWTRRARAWRLAAAATLCGSLMGTTCQTRLHDSVINGTRLLISQVLDPSNLIIVPDDESR